MESKIDEYKALHSKVKTQRKELDMLEKQEKIASNFLKSGISFIPDELNKILAAYMILKETELYIPKIVYSSERETLYYGITNFKSSIKNRDNDTVNAMKKDGIITFECKIPSVNIVNKMATYQFLVDKYELKDMFNQNDYNEPMISNTNFDEHKDIKEFIMYLAKLQIENNKHYTYEEMNEILAIYLEQKKPKTRKLV